MGRILSWSCPESHMWQEDIDVRHFVWLRLPPFGLASLAAAAVASTNDCRGVRPGSNGSGGRRCNRGVAT
jgi:hypothetical protein